LTRLGNYGPLSPELKLSLVKEETTMLGISIRYSYDGPAEPREAAINAFIDNINNDPDIAGKFHYRVNIGKDGTTRVHWGRWDEQHIVETLQ
jgi:hypothetical protein